MNSFTTSSFCRTIAVALGLLCFQNTAFSQTTTVTFSFDNMMLLPDVSHPGAPAEAMSGTFKWTFPVGQFENGTGEFVDLFIPWYGTDIQGLNINVDMSSIEFVIPPPVGNTDLDMTLTFLTDLDPSQSSSILPAQSLFEVQQFGVTHQGHVVSGAAVPDAPMTLTIGGSCPAIQLQVSNATRLSRVALLRSNNLGNFTIPGGRPCAGTLLGLTGNISLATMLTTDAAGQASLSANIPPGACGTVYLQALDLETCRVSATQIVI